MVKRERQSYLRIPQVPSTRRKRGLSESLEKQVQDGKLGRHMKDRKLETLECINESKKS
jgi:hypothetical protein